MKFAIFGNTYQAKKSSHAVTLFKLLKKQGNPRKNAKFAS